MIEAQPQKNAGRNLIFILHPPSPDVTLLNVREDQEWLPAQVTGTGTS